MRYLSVCSGIEAASVAWHPLGWRSAAFSEIEPFPSAVLSHRWPEVPNLGDMTKFQTWPDYAIDLLVGGTPCQSFSIAGLRKGMADPRGNLALTYLAIAARYRPRWILWENVPGVLSDQGNAFGCFLAGLAELGYGWAYRVLDAQHFGVPQRRRRVFVVGYLGDWRRAAAVLFERASLSGNPPPRREAGKDVAPTISARTKGRGGLGTDFDCDGGLIAKTVQAGGHSNNPLDENLICAATGQAGTEILRDQCPTLNCNHEQPYIAHSLRADGFDSNEDGSGRGTPLVPVAIQAGALRENPESGPDGVGVRTDGLAYTLEVRSEVQAVAFTCKDHGADAGDLSPTLRSMGHDGSHANGGGQVAVAFQEAQTGVREYEIAGTIRANGPGHDPVGTRLRLGMVVRRLTPRECERLQGFPDDYSLIEVRRKPAADGPRYKALGNSMAVPVISWLGKRIELVEAL